MFPWIWKVSSSEGILCWYLSHYPHISVYRCRDVEPIVQPPALCIVFLCINQMLWESGSQVVSHRRFFEFWVGAWELHLLPTIQMAILSSPHLLKSTLVFECTSYHYPQCEQYGWHYLSVLCHSFVEKKCHGHSSWSGYYAIFIFSLPVWQLSIWIKNCHTH